MTLTFDVEDLVTRLPEMLAEVEAGHDVLIARGSKAVARVRKEPERPDREQVEAAIAAIKEIRKDIPPTTADEILAWRDEGRR